MFRYGTGELNGGCSTQPRVVGKNFQTESEAPAGYQPGRENNTYQGAERRSIGAPRNCQEPSQVKKGGGRWARKLKNQNCRRLRTHASHPHLPEVTLESTALILKEGRTSCGTLGSQSTHNTDVLSKGQGAPHAWNGNHSNQFFLHV